LNDARRGTKIPQTGAADCVRAFHQEQRMNVVRGFLMGLVSLLVVTATASAQTAVLKGRVVDAQGGVVVSATVTISPSNGASRTMRTSADGLFTFESLAPGRYTVQADAAGFVHLSQVVTVSGSQDDPITLTLQIAGISEGVTVSGTAPTTLRAPAPTGSRLGLTPLETPASVNVITGETIRERGDVSALDAVTRAPGVTNTATPGNGGTALGMRGFTGVDSVKQLYDGVQLIIGTGTVTFPFDVWTIDRIEVLGGPSSVLYGTGAIGGVVNVVPRKPDSSAYRHSGQISGGSFNTWRTMLDSTGPLGSKVSYRLDVSKYSTDGWVDRGDSSTTAVSGALRFEASPTLNVTVSNDYGLQSLAYYSGTPFIDGKLTREIARYNYNVIDSDNYYNDGRTQVRTEWKPSARVSLRNTVYNLRADRHWRGVSTYQFQPVSRMVLRSTYSEIYHDTYQYGQQTEAAFKGTLFGRENVASLGFGYDWVYFQHTNNTPVSGTTLTTIDNATPGYFINVAGTSPQWESRSSVASVYGEDRLVVGEKLSLVGGFRFDRSAVHRDELRAPRTSAERAFTPVSGRGGLVYTIRPRLVLYGQYANATEWVSSLASISATQQIFDLTHGREVEAGAKQSLMGGRGEWTFAAYRIVKNNLLVPDPLNPGVSQQVGQQSSYGVEASTSLALRHGVRVDVNGTILKAKYDDFRENVGGVVIPRDGNRPTNVPLRAANAWLSWDVAGWQARTGLRFVGARFRDTANTGKLPSYTVVDAGLRRRLTRQLTADLRLYNATNKIYVTSPRNSTFDLWYLGKPRAVEFTVGVNF